MQDGECALLLASDEGHLAVVNALIDAKAKPDIQNVEGDTALQLASAQVYLRM